MTDKLYTRTKEGFNSVEYFRAIKEKLAEKMQEMILKDRKIRFKGEK